MGHDDPARLGVRHVHQIIADRVNRHDLQRRQGVNQSGVDGPSTGRRHGDDATRDLSRGQAVGSWPMQRPAAIGRPLFQQPLGQSRHAKDQDVDAHAPF